MLLVVLLLPFLSLGSGASRSDPGGSEAASGAGHSNDLLFQAVTFGDLGALMSAIDRGAALDGRDRAGWTALMYAAASGRIGIIEKLIESGADPNLQEKRGLTPLMVAVLNRQLLAADQLLLVGADATIKTPDNLTASRIALQKGYDEFLPALDQPLRGIAVVVDTETLRVDGSEIRLFGIKGSAEPYRSTLASVLGDNPVLCEPIVDRSFQCFVGKFDVAEIALLNGLASANGEAPESYLAREKTAQQKKMGVWSP